MATTIEDATTCCYAVQDKVWVHDPDGAPWEIYTVVADAPLVEGSMNTDVPGGCCVPAAASNTHVVPIAHPLPVLVAAAAGSDSGCC